LLEVEKESKGVTENCDLEKLSIDEERECVVDEKRERETEREESEVVCSRWRE
jgi:hypothetical protein